MPVDMQTFRRRRLCAGVGRRVQIMGANGYAMEYGMQRHYREPKLFQIFGGTNKIQRNIIARILRKQG